MQTTTISVFKTNGDIWRVFLNPAHWTVNEQGVLYITPSNMAGASTGSVATTLPFVIEKTN
jgi:hypothetical protein